MYLAIRDIRFAKGRFALMGGVVALITLLLVMLSGLTAGLGNQSTSALAALPGRPDWSSAPPPGAAPRPRLPSPRSRAPNWPVVGARRRRATPSCRDQPEPLPGDSAPKACRHARPAWRSSAPSPAQAWLPAPLAEGTVAVGARLAEDLELSIGSHATVGGADLVVTAVVPEQWYSHTGVVWTTLADWRKLAHIARRGRRDGDRGDIRLHRRNRGGSSMPPTPPPGTVSTTIGTGPSRPSAPTRARTARCCSCRPSSTASQPW